jgi:asparagine synthase (glutamine-hydrolysing)
MCGIAGILSLDKSSISESSIKNMTDSLYHRGPDGGGIWIDTTDNIGLGHRRLSIIDLSESGKQPMHYLDRYTITFNGEIYNYIEIKTFLLTKGYVFKTSTDTEVLLALFDHKGYDCLGLLDGMFAFAIWDKVAKKLFCARDRFGEKPFYYSINDSSFVFSSEIKALWAYGLPKIKNDVMIFNYLYFNSINNPDNLSETFYDNIKLLKPSSYLVINVKLEIEIEKKYWDVDYTNINTTFSYEQAKIDFADLLQSSVNLRLRSDVPIGSSLSGGLDSSVIVALINKSSINGLQQKTFSAKFPGFLKDETKYIDLVNQSINADAYDCFPNKNSFIESIDNIIHHQDEPFGSASIVAQYEVMKLAKKNGVTVMLDGQGADEILCGYHGLVDSYFFELYKSNKTLYKEQLSIYKDIQSNNEINNLNRRIRNQQVKFKLGNNSINKILLAKTNLIEFISPKIEKEFYFDLKNKKFNNKYIFNTLNEALYYSTFKGGLQELLRYADRNSMANSIEVRLPFLSHKIVEFLFLLPSEYKFKNGFTKYILRDSMMQYLPDEIIWRKDKIGYEPPQKDWLSDFKINLNTGIIKNTKNVDIWKQIMFEKFKF